MTLQQIIRVKLTDYAEKYGTKRKGTKKKHIFYKNKEICKEAYDRLKFLELDDFEEIFRFRIGSKFRIYGVTSGCTFLMLWHDPIHKILPLD